MEMWRYFRDVFVVLGVLLLLSGLLASWSLFCVITWLTLAVWSWIYDCKLLRQVRRKRRS